MDAMWTMIQDVSLDAWCAKKSGWYPGDLILCKRDVGDESNVG